MTLKLQAAEMDIVAAYGYVRVVRELFQSYRDNVESKHLAWLKSAIDLAVQCGLEVSPEILAATAPAGSAAATSAPAPTSLVDPDAAAAGDSGVISSGASASAELGGPNPAAPGSTRLPRQCASVYRDNIPANSTSIHLLRNMLIPLLDHLLTELGSRFGELQQAAVSGFAILPCAFLVPNSPTFKPMTERRAAVSKFVRLAEHGALSVSKVVGELEGWEVDWRLWYEAATKASVAEEPPRIPRTLSEVLQTRAVDMGMYPNITLLLRRLATLPVTSCQCERSISTLRLIKTHVRSSMGQDRLSDLCMLRWHYSFKFDLEQLLDDFASMNSARKSALILSKS
eukprot:m.256028 g.256028  ORF g.256028 m.256028 type:complete len:342 (-) comp19901_c0_seq1:60-1085(-)